MPSQQTMQDLLPNFVDSLTQNGRSPLTIVAYKTDLEQLATFLTQQSKVLPEDIRPSDIEGFRDSLLANKYTPKSVSRKLNAVKTFFRWLKDNKHIVSDPSKDVEHPKIESSPPRFLKPIEYRALRDAARGDARVAAIIELILQTGMRISEVASLEQKNLKNLTVVIQAYASQPERKIPLNTPSKKALEGYAKQRPQLDSPYVFISRSGKALAVRNIRASIERFMQRGGIENASVNDLRTTFIVENLKRGVSLVTVSQAVGHKRISTTERYLELAEVKEPGKKQQLEEL